MKQRNQIGKYTKKEDFLNAKVGRVFVTPKNNEYTFNYKKEGRKYIFIISWNGYKMQVSESDYNRTPIDTLIEIIKKGSKVK
jgi:hypothetical protein